MKPTKSQIVKVLQAEIDCIIYSKQEYDHVKKRFRRLPTDPQALYEIKCLKMAIEAVKQAGKQRGGRK